MENSSRDRSQKSYTLMRRTYDLTMSVLILGLGVVVAFADYWHIQAIMDRDVVLRYLFVGICLLYGGFRLYRGIKAEY